MVSLKDYLKFWESVSTDTRGVTGMLPVTVDDGMGRRIQALPRESVTLFVMPPVADSKLSQPDSYMEENDCVVFLMARYDPQRAAAVDVQASTQPMIEEVKSLLVDRLGWCSGMRLDLKSVTTMPETKFYAGFAGWSLGFRIYT